MRFRISIDINNLSLRELEDLIFLNDGLYCCCDQPIKRGTIMNNDHSEGIIVRGFEMNQWVYFNCPKHDYDSSINKVINNILKRNAENIFNRELFKMRCAYVSLKRSID